jgi:hypothetical protein
MTAVDEPEVVEGEIVDDAPLPARRDTVVFELDQRRARAYAASKYWPDAATLAQALVKIEAGRELGLPAIVAMSEVHVIQGKPTLGAGALATLVKNSGRYDYRVVELTDERCVLRFVDVQAGDLGESVFTMDDARKAGLAGRSTWRQYPRNMLFARALSNGVAWFCPDVTTGRVYVPDELDGIGAVLEEPAKVAEPAADEAEPKPATSKEPPVEATKEQLQQIRELVARLSELRPESDWKQTCRRITGGGPELMTVSIADMLIDKLRQNVKAAEEFDAGAA